MLEDTPETQALEAPKNLYHAAQPLELAKSKIKFQSPENWVSEGMNSKLPPEYRLPADIADMKRPAGMTRYQCKLMHLIFATLCRNKSPVFQIGRAEIGKFITGKSSNVRSDRIVRTIDGLAGLEFVFASTSLRLWNLKPWPPTLLFGTAPVLTRQSATFEIHPNIYKSFMDPKIYEYISLDVINCLNSEPALFLYPPSQIRLKVKAQRELRVLRKAHDFSSPVLETDNGFPSRIDDVSTWLGSSYKEPARIIGDLKRAAKALTKTFGEGGLPRLDVFGLQKDAEGRVYKDEAKKKYVRFNFELPPRSIFYEHLNQTPSDYHVYRLSAPQALFIKPGYLKATASVVGWAQGDALSAKAIKVLWMKHIADLGKNLFNDYNRIEEVYSEFHERTIRNYRVNSRIELPSDTEMEEINKAWSALTQNQNLRTPEKLKHVPNIKVSAPSIMNSDTEIGTDPFGIPFSRPPITKHELLTENHIGSMYVRDPRKHAEIFIATTLEPIVNNPLEQSFMTEIYKLKPKHIPFMSTEQILKLQRQRRRPAYIGDLMKAHKKSSD